MTPGPLIVRNPSDRGRLDSVSVFTSRRAPVSLMLYQIDPVRSRILAAFALAPLSRPQAARVAWHLLLAALIPRCCRVEQDNAHPDSDELPAVEDHHAR